MHRWGLNPLSGSVHFTIARKTKALASLHSEEFTTKHLLLKETFLSMLVCLSIYTTVKHARPSVKRWAVSLQLLDTIRRCRAPLTGVRYLHKAFKQKKQEACRINVIFYFIWVTTKLVVSRELCVNQVMNAVCLSGSWSQSQ